MPATKPQLSCLAARKQLLLIESEVNRAQLQREWDDFRVAARTATAPARRVLTIVRGVGSLFQRLRGPRPAATNGERKKFAWLAPLLEGARLSASLWGAFQSRER